MRTLCIDTAYKYLTCAIIEDDHVLAGECIECFKRQSEEVFLTLQKVFDKANIERTDIDSICISKGPGSYTGVRIGMSIAKVLAATLNCDLYTISTLKLYANNHSNCMVILNARADRAYVGIYDKSNVIMNDCILTIDKIDCKDYKVMGDGSLINLTDNFDNICECFLNTKDSWIKVDEVAFLVPEYLKESESYYR